MKKTAYLFKSLSEETRLRIVLLLQEKGELCICDLMVALHLPQSTVSRHVAYLKNAGWLQDRRGGVWMHYSLSADLGRPQRDLLVMISAICAASPEAEQDRIHLQQQTEGEKC